MDGWPGDAELDAAGQLISETLPPTPLVRLWSAATEVHLKLETTQPTGSFKIRGALAAVSAYAAAGRPIVTASAGNHGLGIAWAAARLDVPATVVVPENASPTKVEALRRYPISLVLHGQSYDEAEAHALSLAQDAQFVSAYNDPQVIAGQGSIVAELTAQLDGPFTALVPVGGGGLVSGIALAARRAAVEIEVIGVEAAASRAVSTAVEAGRMTQVEVGPTIADGLAGNLDPATVSPDILRATGTRVLAADEPSLYRAIRVLAADAGVYAEGSAAAGLAAYLDGAVPADRPVVAIVTGRNITAATFTSAITRS